MGVSSGGREDMESTIFMVKRILVSLSNYLSCSSHFLKDIHIILLMSVL